MTSAILVQRSTNWANKPTGSWSMSWVQMNIQVNECTHLRRIRSLDQNRSLYGGWLMKLHLGQFFGRKKAQRSIRSTLYLFQCVTWRIQTVFRRSDHLAVVYPFIESIGQLCLFWRLRRHKWTSSRGHHVRMQFPLKKFCPSCDKQVKCPRAIKD